MERYVGFYIEEPVGNNVFSYDERTNKKIFVPKLIKGTLDDVDFRHTNVIIRNNYIHNVTRAGIHADGMLKNEEIYNIFDTDKFLNRPALVSVSNTSGAAGIAYWINAYYKLPQGSQVDKNSELVSRLKEWVDKEYEEGRVTVLTDDELIAKIDSICKELHIKL